MIDRRKMLMLGAMGIGALALAGCDKVVGETYRYRWTVEVETPQGLRIGTGVIEVTTKKGIEFPGPEAGGIRTTFKGEAVAVDLPGGQTLFVLLDRADGLLLTAYKPWLPDTSRVPLLDRIRAAKKLNIIATVPRWWPAIAPSKEPWDAYPRFVRFRDIRDPTSMELVNPDNLAASFGKAIKLRRITAQITDDEVTMGTNKRLPWLADVSQHRGTILPNPPRLMKNATPNQLITPSDFYQENRL